jgi:hypothetical protein
MPFLEAVTFLLTSAAELSCLQEIRGYIFHTEVCNKKTSSTEFHPETYVLCVLEAFCPTLKCTINFHPASALIGNS